MRSTEAIQNLVYSALESMLCQPEMYFPCSVVEFEARISSYLWVLAISDEQEENWSQTLEQMRAQRNWAAPLDIVASVQSDVGSTEDKESIEGVIEFYAEFAERLGFDSEDQDAEHGPE